MSKLYVVSIRWIDVKFEPTVVDSVLGKFGEWIRVNGFTWFLWTDGSPDEITEELLGRLGRKSGVIIAALEARAAVGWSPGWIWDWLNDKMARQLRRE